ncbi:MAG: hypothetical protein J7L07_10985, partial [Candidatus Odinarchaeota archaeon]|nr:hypothetical protein [Candidatus Odinarchaeota archaeon]
LIVLILLMGVHFSSLDRLFEKKNGGAKGRKEEKSRRWEIHSEDVYAQYCRYNTKMEGYTHC